MNMESSSRPSSQRPPRSLVLEPRVSQAGLESLARASVDLARDLAREFVEPPEQTSMLVPQGSYFLVRPYVAGGEGGESVNGDVGAAKAAAADLESAPSGGNNGDGGDGLDGIHTRQHGRHGPVRRRLTPQELGGMPKGTCEDGIRRRGNTFR